MTTDAAAFKNDLMSHRLRDIFAWFVFAGVLLAAVSWVGKGPPLGVPEHLPPAGMYQAMANLICLIAAFDAIFIAGVYIFSQPSAKLPGDVHERRHHHAGRVGFMSLIAFAFSLVGIVLALLPSNRQGSALFEEPLMVGGAFALMALISGLGIVLSQRRQRLFDRRHA